MSVTITKTKEQADAERQKKAERAKAFIAEAVCPYCKVNDYVDYVSEYASTTNVLIGIMNSLYLMPNKVRRKYTCEKCGAEWVGDWYEC